MSLVLRWVDTDGTVGFAEVLERIEREEQLAFVAFATPLQVTTTLERKLFGYAADREITQAYAYVLFRGKS